MKLFWKQFIGIICLILLVFSIFGSLLLYSSFQMSLEEEKSRIVEDISIFQYAILSSLQSLPEEYEAVDYAVGQITDSIIQSRGNGQDIVRIYKENAVLIYESRRNTQNAEKKETDVWNDYGLSAADPIWRDRQGVYEVQKSAEEYFLKSLSVMETSQGRYYLEINRNISNIYVNREELYQQYKIVLLVVIALSLVLSLAFSVSFTRPILRLSKGTRQFAGGDYKSRVKVRGNDEVTVLMEDFNEMADRLEDNMRQIKEEVRKQEEFTAAFAHELKTPLTSIVGYGDMLRTMDLSKEDLLMCGDYIYQQGTRLSRLSHKMLELVGMDKQKISCSKLDLADVMKKAVRIMQIPLLEKKLHYRRQLEKGVIWGDEDLLISLFCNLMDNSRKACEEGGQLEWKGEIRENETYVLSLKDNGRGIPQEEQGRIKEAFYMVDKSRARKEGGAGIGMALCEKIISIHNATWKIESELGKGTKISIYFPLAKEELYVEE
ncbi:MAG: HAMP domain-containing histidine kinase [Lachnospiraceae bacterium]|nr:HAMP domain-containing histidine kinase [Lachnospiraceae bacterium]